MEPINERLCELIVAEVTHGILDGIHVMFGTIKEGIMKLVDECLRAFLAEIVVGQIGALPPSFQKFKACGASELFGAKAPNASRCWIIYMEIAQRMSFFHKGANGGFVSCLLWEWARDC